MHNRLNNDSKQRSILMLALSAILSAVLTLLPLVPAAAGELIVSAASSLSNAFKAVGQAYEQQYPDTTLLMNFAASDVLMQQIVMGAPADVFASADQIAMDKAAAQNAIVPSSRRNFAGNQLVLIVPHDSQLHIKKLSDLTQAAVRRITYGNPAFVPVGRYTQSTLEQAGLWQSVTAKGFPGENVRQSLDYVARGEVDAGFVFATDAAIMPEKVSVVLRLSAPLAIRYPVAVTAGSKRSAEAERFITYLRSHAAQAIMAQYGFLPP